MNHVPSYFRTISYQSQDGTSGATFSEDRKYRYQLWRRWDQTRHALKWVMLNPSTADETTDDPTIKKCVKFARKWGYGGIKVVNLFGYRSTDPKALKKLTYSEAVGPSNNFFMIQALAENGMNIAAWGQGGKIFSRAEIFLKEMAPREGTKLHALKLSKDGTPYHPLYLRDDSQPFML